MKTSPHVSFVVPFSPGKAYTQSRKEVLLHM